MKKVLTWIKSNLLIVIFSTIIVAVVPASYFVSSKWNNSIRDARQKAVDADYTKLTKSDVDYVLGSVEPGEPLYEFKWAPNAAVTKYFAEQKKTLEAQAGGVVKAAEAFNSHSHREADGSVRVLVPGLLPNSSGPAFQSMAGRMVSLLVGMDSQPSVYKALFEAIGAGEPVPGTDLAQHLADARQREVDQIIGAQAGRTLTADEDAKVTKALVEKRKAYLQSYARRFSVYGTPAAVSGFVPTGAIKETVPIKKCFQWQADYWLVEDILAAIKAANIGVDGEVLSVSDAVVKRIEKITPRPSPLGAVGSEFGGSGGENVRAGGEGDPAVPEAPAAAPAPNAQVVPDFTRSITGRWGGPGNGVYDVRRVDLVLIVSARNLPKLIDAISRTNFMTVVDCDLYDVDVWADLDMGFYYGEESVVRAKIEVETVWLRSWTTALMPKEIKAALGIPEPEPTPEGEKKPDGPG